MMKFFAVVVGVAGAVLALWLGGWVLFVGGIVQVIEGVTSDPVSGKDIVMGLLRVISAHLVAVPTFVVMSDLAAFIWSESNVAKRRKRLRQRGW